jgi:hypothetical protein
VITSIGNLNFDYYVYPGQIQINPDGTISSPSSPIVSSTEPRAAGTGLGTNHIIVAMGSLYGPTNPVHNATPPSSGVLFTFGVSGECNVTISPNSLRGGVVLENAQSASVYAPITHVIPEPGTIILLAAGGILLRRKH